MLDSSSCGVELRFQADAMLLASVARVFVLYTCVYGYVPTYADIGVERAHWGNSRQYPLLRGFVL